jgi:tetratricopeptide (TPR) repeat protein
MTEEAAQAKRLFDRELWDQAASAFERVAKGDTGDDEGNKQLAEYYRAAALHRGGHVDEAATAFLAIAGRPAHIKHAETLLWLVKLADAAPEVARAMAFYDLASAMRFSAPAQVDTQQGAFFLLGRERFERGAKPEARDLFTRVEASSRWYPLARECLELLDAR